MVIIWDRTMVVIEWFDKLFFFFFAILCIEGYIVLKVIWVLPG